MQSHEWLAALLMRVDECVADWLQAAAMTVSAGGAGDAGNAGSAGEAGEARDREGVMDLLARITEHRDNLSVHARERGEEGGGAVRGNAAWLSALLVMWRWFLKDAAQLAVIHVCMYACMHACMRACMHVQDVCMYMYLRTVCLDGVC